MRRQLSREIGIYTVGFFVSSGLMYLAVPIYTRVFSPDEYSHLTFIQSVAAAVAGVLVLGGDVALSRFWFQQHTHHRRTTLVWTWIGFLTAWSVLVVALLVPFSPLFARWSFGSADLWLLFLLGLGTLPLTQLNRMLAQILRNEFRATHFAATSVLLGLLTLTCGLLLAIGLGLGIPGILAGALIAEAIVIALRAWLVRSYRSPAFDRALLNSMLRFGVPLVPGSVSFWVIASSDRIIVGLLAGATELGYYAVSTSVVAVFAVLLVAVGQAWLPRIVQLYEDDPEQSEIVAGRVFAVLVLILTGMAAAISLLAPVIISIVSGPEYAPAAQTLPLLALGAVLFGTTVLTGNGLELGKRTKELAVIAVIAAAINVTAALALVPRFGSMGAAMASVLGYATLTGCFLVRSRRVWRMRLHAPLLLASGAVLVLVVAIQTAHLSGT